MNTETVSSHRHRNGGCSPNKIIGGATSTFCSPIFFCSLHLELRRNLQTVRLLLTQKFSKIPQLLGLCPRPHCTMCIPFFRKIHIAWSYTLSLIVFIVFRHFLLPKPKIRSIFAPPTKKSFPRLCSRWPPIGPSQSAWAMSHRPAYTGSQ